MHEKRFDGSIERLRSPERVARLEVERVVSLCLESEELKSVLDVGVGSGLFAEAFAKHGLQVAGVDVNPEMVVAARQFVPQGDFREATAEALPFKMVSSTWYSSACSCTNRMNRSKSYKRPGGYHAGVFVSWNGLTWKASSALPWLTV